MIIIKVYNMGCDKNNEYRIKQIQKKKSDKFSVKLKRDIHKMLKLLKFLIRVYIYKLQCEIRIRKYVCWWTCELCDDKLLCALISIIKLYIVLLYTHTHTHTLYTHILRLSHAISETKYSAISLNNVNKIFISKVGIM